MGSLESDTTERLHFHFSLSCIEEGNGNPLQCFCLENPMDGEAWWAAVHGVAQIQTRLKWLSSSNSSSSSNCFRVSASICHEVMGPVAMILVFWMMSFKPTFSLSSFFHFHQEGLQFLFTFYLKGGVICVSEVTDISPGNLDCSLCFSHLSISCDVLCI